jgi:hypothetical protein
LTIGDRGIQLCQCGFIQQAKFVASFHASQYGNEFLLEHGRFLIEMGLQLEWAKGRFPLSRSQLGKEAEKNRNLVLSNSFAA